MGASEFASVIRARTLREAATEIDDLKGSTYGDGHPVFDAAQHKALSIAVDYLRAWARTPHLDNVDRPAPGTTRTVSEVLALVVEYGLACRAEDGWDGEDYQVDELYALISAAVVELADERITS